MCAVENGEKVPGRRKRRRARRRIAFDELLVRRRPRREYRRLRAGGTRHPGDQNAHGGGQRVPADDYPNIYACGDVAGPYQFTHTAAHMAWYAAVNALFGGFRKFHVDYSVIPWATFTDPEVARVGLNEKEAKEKGIAHEV